MSDETKAVVVWQEGDTRIVRNAEGKHVLETVRRHDALGVEQYCEVKPADMLCVDGGMYKWAERLWEKLLSMRAKA